MMSCRHTRQLSRTEFPAADTGKVATVKDSTSEAAAAEFNANLLNGVRKNHIAFKTFSAKLKIDFENDKQKQQNVSTSLRMQKDSIIWISITAPIIGEVARAVITPDSLKAYDRMNKKLYLRKLSDAQDLLNIPFDFKTMQDLFIGNPVFLTNTVYQVVKTPSIVSFSCDSTSFTSLFNVFSDDYLLQQSKVMDKDENNPSRRSCELTYGEYRDVAGRKFATSRRIFVEEKNVTKVAMDFIRYDFDMPLNFPFTIPSGYRQQ